MFLERFVELRNNRDRHERRYPWFRITPEPEREPASERSCADCGKDVSGWKPVHPVEGRRGVLCTACWIQGLVSPGPGGTQATVKSRLSTPDHSS